jgi:hypothetical protein
MSKPGKISARERRRPAGKASGNDIAEEIVLSQNAYCYNNRSDIKELAPERQTGFLKGIRAIEFEIF